MRSRYISSLCTALFVALLVTPALAQRAADGKFQTNPRPRVLPQASWAGVGTGPEVVHNYAPFNQVVFNDGAITGLDPETVQLFGAPAGVYTQYSVSVQWSAVSGDPWSNEAIWAFNDTGTLTPTIWNADPGPAGNSANNGDPVTLTWNGFMDVPYNTAQPFHYLMAQTFGGSTANWNNISISINNNPPVAPVAAQSFQGGSLNGTLAAGEVKWYKFNYTDGPGGLTLDTIGSLLAPSNDTEIGLYYGPTGTLIASDDDSGPDLLSLLSFAPGELINGEYYLAIGGFNTTFGPAFSVTSTSTNTGSFVINGISIPEPGSLAVLGAAAVLFVRRRRA